MPSADANTTPTMINRIGTNRLCPDLRLRHEADSPDAFIPLGIDAKFQFVKVVRREHGRPPCL
jgi:hypothetical protein